MASPLATKNAKSPFNDDPSRPDRGEYVVIRTQDPIYPSILYDFHVHRRLICCPGSFFNNILEDARPTEYKEGMPVVVLNGEDSDIIRDLLLLCCFSEFGKYPLFNEGDQVMRVLGAARKYCVGSDQLIIHAKKALESSSILPERLYVIGVRCKWEDICKLAAKRAVNMNRPPEIGFPFTTNELQHLTSDQIAAFLRYKDSAKRLVHDYIQDITFIEDNCDNYYIPDLNRETLPFKTNIHGQHEGKESGHSAECEAGIRRGIDIEVLNYYHPDDGLPYTAVIRAPRWWQQYLRDVAEKFERNPHRSVLTDVSLIKQAVIRATEDCPKCSADIFDLSFRMFNWVINEFVVGIQHKADMMDAHQLELHF